MSVELLRQAKRSLHFRRVSTVCSLGLGRMMAMGAVLTANSVDGVMCLGL
jgi:hypothetical protein